MAPVRFSINQDQPAPLLHILYGPREDHGFRFPGIRRTDHRSVHPTLFFFYEDGFTIICVTAKYCPLGGPDYCGVFCPLTDELGTLLCYPIKKRREDGD